MAFIDKLFRKAPVKVDATQLLGITNAVRNITSGNEDPNKYINTASPLSPYAAISAVLTCLQIRADAVGSVPLNIEKKLPNGTWVEDENHRLYNFAKYSPYALNEITSGDFHKSLSYERDQCGNFYAKLTFDEDGLPNGAVPIVNGNRVTIDKDPQTSEIRYSLDGTIYQRSQILHIKNLLIGSPFQGMSVLAVASAVFDNADKTMEMVSSIIDNSYKPGIVLSTTLALKPEQIKDAEDKLNAKFSNFKNAGGALILGNGLKPERVAFFTEADIAFLATRNFSYSEIAAMFRIPNYLLNLTGDRKPAASQEQEQREFMLNCIRPITNSIQDAYNLQLLTQEERGKWRFRFDFTDVIQPDTQARYAADASALTAGWKKLNEVRREHGYEPVDGGDVCYLPLNKAPVGSTTATPTAS